MSILTFDSNLVTLKLGKCQNNQQISKIMVKGLFSILKIMGEY